MKKRADLPGTDHSTTVDRQERPILEAIQGAPSVRKLKTCGINWTGSTYQKRLQLRPVEIAGTQKQIYEGQLFLGSRKRRIRIYPVPAATMEALCQELGAILDRRGVTVEGSPIHHNMEEPTMQQITTNGHDPMNAEDLWDYCGLIMHDGEEQTKTLEAQEASLQAQLNTVRLKKQDVKAHALEALSQALRDLDKTR